MSKTDSIVDKYKSYVIPTYAQSAVMVRGRGTKLWDADGRVYLDFGSGIATVNLGHCHPAVLEALTTQAAELIHVSNLYYNERQAQLAEKLSVISGGAKCFFCNSGAEANEAMFKIARAWGQERGRYGIVSMKNSFHGRTLAGMAATGQEKIRKGFAPMPDGFVHAELNNLDSVAAAVNERTAAIIVEAVQGEGGVNPATPEFLQGVRKLCDDQKLLMFCDEVQCGMGRTGTWFGFEAAGIKPDAFSLAKALGNGFPIGAVVARASCSGVLQPGMHASTFGGTPLACAVALAVLRAIETEELLEKAARAGQLLREGLEGFVEQFAHVKEVRGAGLMLGLVLDQPAKPVFERMLEIGLITIPTAENVIRLLPPLNVKDDEIEEALDIMHDALEELHQGEPAAAPDAGAQAE